MNKKIKVIVTGGAGFIGSHLAKQLLKEDYEVVVIDNLSTGKKENIPPQAKFFNADIINFGEIRSIFSVAKYVFHLAAIPSVQYSIEFPQETNNTNAGGTLNVLMAAKEAGVKRVIFSSSCSVYGDSQKLPTDEMSEINPKSPYALQKYISERYCRLFSEIHGLETVCLRYFNVYGKGQSSVGAYASVIAKFLELKSKKMPLSIFGDGNQTRDFINVSDVVRANILAATSGKVGRGESINIGFAKSCSVNEIASVIGGSIEYLPPRAELRNSLADITLAKTLIDFEPRISFVDGIHDLM